MSEHYELIRTSPKYRNFLMLEEMRAEMQPPLYTEPPKVIQSNVTYKTYVGIDKKALELQKRIARLESLIEPLISKKDTYTIKL